jgi:hypothetical protein
VETGLRLDDRVQIGKGLRAGERIVLSGNFLISSESRLKEGTEMYAPAADPRPNVGESPQKQTELKKSEPEPSVRRVPTTNIAPHTGRRHG